jgi:hypothetical protein
MRPPRHLAGGLACLALFALAVAARADAPDPLRLVPDQADAYVEITQPRKLVESGLSLEIVKSLQHLAPVQEAYDSTTARRFYQLLAYFEKELGAKWPELLDRLAGGGVVLAIKGGQEPNPALIVLQGTDEALTRRFYEKALLVIEQELARQESKEKVEKKAYRGVEAVRVGDDFHAAAAGSAIVFSNKGEVLQMALDLHLDGGKGDKKSLAGHAGVAGAKKLLPRDPLARLWLNLARVKQSDEAKQVFTSPRNDVNLTVLFGGWIDVAARSDYLCGGLYQDKDGYTLTFRMPAGREGASADLAVNAPPADGPGVLPPLQPKGTLFSTSFYYDFSKYWTDRTKLFNAEQVKALEEADKNPGAALAGLKVSKVLSQSGARHRFVAVNQPKVGYKKEPQQSIPAFAFVMEMREPDEFARNMDATLRGAALLAGQQVKLKLVEEKHGEHQIVGYRFPEDGKYPDDAGDVRFNFSPCYVRVGDQFVFCSTLELCHELIDLLEKEAKSGPAKTSHAAVLAQLHGEGGAQALALLKDNLVTQAVLGQAVPVEEARKQVEDFIDVVRRLGVLNVETVYEANQFRADVRLRLAK